MTDDRRLESGLTPIRPGSPDGQAARPSPRTRLGAYAVTLDGDDRILLCRLSADEVEAGAWTLPGGGVEFGEHPDAAVLRELEEEAGLTGRIESVLGIFSRVYPRSRAAGGADMHFIGFLYRVTPTGGDLRDEVDGSTETCAWFGRGELGALRIVGVARHAIALALPGAELPEPLP
ncbi:MAG TPA: NUDIX domain-containing protein [Patescibacteria group bacterium]|nr:NUDIX domain-containing protein [Patescibacteria group bacterium]